MATSAATVDHLLDLLSAAGDLFARKMHIRINLVFAKAHLGIIDQSRHIIRTNGGFDDRKTQHCRPIARGRKQCRPRAARRNIQTFEGANIGLTLR